MTPEKDLQLCEKYPKIFEYRNSADKRYPISWGISCADGWFNIIDEACRLIQNRCDLIKDRENKDIQVSAVQIKEKFGSLRFYVIGGDEYTDGVISMAEGLSAKVCEDCGDSAELYTGGWWMTQCEKCRRKYIEKNSNNKTIDDEKV